MSKWIVTKRKDWVEFSPTNRWIVHREEELRGICETWEEGLADRIAAALNREPLPGSPEDNIDRLITAGNILAKTMDKLIDDNGDINIIRLAELINAREYWRIVTEQCAVKTTENKKEPTNG